MVLWNPSDIYLALIGGTIIGIATSTHYLLMGRVTGFSGIFYSLITFDKSSFYWKLSLMAAVMLASCIMFLIYEFKYKLASQLASPSFQEQTLLLIPLT